MTNISLLRHGINYSCKKFYSTAPGVNLTIPFSSLMRGQSKLKCFSFARHFQESLVFVNKAVLALLVNIRLCLQGTNSLAYFAATSVKKKKYF